MNGHSPAIDATHAVHWTPSGPVSEAPPTEEPTRRRRPRRDEDACWTARSAARIPLVALTLPTVLALVVAQLPDLLTDLYLARVVRQLDPLVIDSLVSRIGSAPDGSRDLWVLVLVAGSGLLAACTRARWRPDTAVLWFVGGLVTAGLVVVAAQGLRDDLWGHALGSVLALRAAAAAAVTAATAARKTEPGWAGGSTLRWTPWLVGYFLTVLPVLVVGRSVDPPAGSAVDPLSLATAASPLTVVQFLNGAWLGIAAWALLQIAVQPRWRRVSAALLVLAVAVGPLRDLAQVSPAVLAQLAAWSR